MYTPTPQKKEITKKKFNMFNQPILISGLHISKFCHAPSCLIQTSKVPLVSVVDVLSLPLASRGNTQRLVPHTSYSDAHVLHYFG